MKKNNAVYMIVGALVVATALIAWLMYGGADPGTQKEEVYIPVNAKVKNTTVARDKDGKMLWEFTVEELEQVKLTGEGILKGVKGKLYREDGSILEVVAGGGKVNAEAKDFELTDQVVMIYSAGGKLTADNVKWEQEKDIITAVGQVKVLKDDILATGDKIITSSAFEKVKLTGNAEVQRGGTYNE